MTKSWVLWVDADDNYSIMLYIKGCNYTSFKISKEEALKIEKEFNITAYVVPF